MKTSVLIDAAFFLKRYRRLRGTQEPELVADDLHRYACEHLNEHIDGLKSTIPKTNGSLP